VESIQDQEDQERRLTAVILCDELCEIIGGDICRDYFLYELISFQDDTEFKIRREVVTRLVRLSRLLEEKMFAGVIIPFYRKLSSDPMWSVRKACVEILPHIANIASNDVKNVQLVPLFEKFSKDNSKWVKTTAL